MKRVVIAAVCALVATCLGACGGNDDDSVSVRIVSPRPGAVVEGRTMTVRLDTHGEAFKVLLDGRSVTDRFEKTSGEQTARLRLGRDYRQGDGTLLVATGPRFSPKRVVRSVSFTAALRDDTLLTHSASSSGGRVALRISSRRTIGTARVSVNGHRMSDDDVTTSGKGATATLAATDGLKHGTNTVVMDVRHADGTLSTRRAKVVVPRSAVMAGADGPGSAAVGRTVALKGVAAPADGDASATARWTVASAPSGSRATILDATSTRPRLRPDKPGHYELRLVATSADGAQRSVDTTGLDVNVTDDPMGLPVQTISQDGSIVVGTTVKKPQGTWIHMLVVSKAYGTVTLDQGFDTGDGKKLVDAIGKVSSDDTVVLSGQDKKISGELDTGNLTKAFAKLGGTLDTDGPTPHGAADLASGQWSLIGRNGLAAGQATQNLGMVVRPVPAVQDGAPGLRGSLNGYLQRPLKKNSYAYVSPEFASVDTREPSSTSTRNVMKVHGYEYKSSVVPAGSFAVHVVALYPESLALYKQGTFVVGKQSGALRDLLFSLNGGSTYRRPCYKIPSDNSPCKGEGFVQGGRTIPPVVLLQTFGTPPTAPVGDANWVDDYLPSADTNVLHTHQQWDGGPFAWTDKNPFHAAIKQYDALQPSVAGEIGKLAGTEWHDVAANLGEPGRTGLAVVASAQLARRGDAVAVAGTSSSKVTTSARVVATITRNAQSQWTARTPSAQGGFGQGSFDTADFYQQLYAKQHSWPATNRKAMAYAAEQLFRDPTVTDVRQTYTDKDSWASGSANYRRDLADLPMPGGDPGFTTADLSALKKVLDPEFENLGLVWNGIENWQHLYGNSKSLAAYVDLQQVANAVLDQIHESEREAAKQEAEIDPLDVSSASLLIAEELADIAGPETFGVAPAVMGAVSAGIDLANALSPPEPKNLTDNGQVIRDKASALGVDLVVQAKQASDTLDHFGTVFVSDPGKLAAVGDRFRSRWQYKPSQADDVVQSLSIATKTGFYTSLLPLAYEQWVIAPKTTEDNPNAGDPVKDFSCAYYDGDGDEDGSVKPFSKSPAGAVDTIRWSTSNQEGSSDSTGRGLKIDSGGNRLSRKNGGIRHSGQAPGDWIDALFAPPNDDDSSVAPTSLGIDKDWFYGLPVWSKRKLYCSPDDSPVNPYGNG